MIETGFTYLRNMLAKVGVTAKQQHLDREQYHSDGNLSLPSSVTGKWLMTLLRCCFVPIIIGSVLSGLRFYMVISCVAYSCMNRQKTGSNILQR